MIVRLHKSKQYLLLTLKVLILGFTFVYVYQKIYNNDSLNFQAFMEQLKVNRASSLQIGFFIVLATGNWFFEILKWKTVVKMIRNISFYEAMKQSLASLTISLATPNRIGEYGAKAYFFKKEQRKQILFLNFFSHLCQMITTSFFGIIGISFVVQHYELNIVSNNLIIFLIAISGCGFFFYSIRNRQLFIKGFTLKKIDASLKGIGPLIGSRVLLFSMLRYCLFSFLFYILLDYFGVSIPLFEALGLIFSMYFLVSVLPSIFLFDVVIRGGVAVWLFSLAGISAFPVLCTVLAMWLLNFLFPALLGSYYMFAYQRESE